MGYIDSLAFEEEATEELCDEYIEPIEEENTEELCCKFDIIQNIMLVNSEQIIT